MNSIEKMNNKTCFKFYEGWRVFTQLYKDRLGMDVTPQMIYVLESLTVDKPIKMNDLSEAMKLDSSAVSTLVARMEKKKLVKRTHGTEDRRTVFVSLTKDGESIKHLNEASVSIMDSDIRSLLSLNEIECLDSILEKMNGLVNQPAKV